MIFARGMGGGKAGPASLYFLVPPRRATFSAFRFLPSPPARARKPLGDDAGARVAEDLPNLVKLRTFVVLLGKVLFGKAK